jgi:hypothetical protein
MGAFFSNIQLYINNKDKDAYREHLIAVIDNKYIESGYKKNKTKRGTDISYRICEVDDTPWVTVFERDSDADLEKDYFESILKNLTEKLQTTGIGIMVNDSNLYIIILVKNGLILDYIYNGEENAIFNFEEIEWTKILKKSFNIENLKASLNQDSSIVEPVVKKIAVLLNINTDNCLTGYNYSLEENIGNSTSLHYKSFIDQNEKQLLGPASLTMFSGNTVSNVSIDEEYIIKFQISNQGLSSKGIDVVLSGECIESDLILPIEVKLLEKIFDEKCESWIQPLKFINSTTNERVSYARFEEFNIRKGYKSKRPVKNKDYEKDFKKRMVSAFTIEIKFKVIEQFSSKTFYIFCSPLENREDGTFQFQIDLKQS